MRRVISIVLGVGLFGGGVYVLYTPFYRSTSFWGLGVLGACLMAIIGAGVIVAELMNDGAENHFQSSESEEVRPSKFHNTIRETIVALFVAPIIGAIAVVGFQIVSYLRNGIWLSFSIIDGVNYLFDFSWTKYPTDWIGLHNLLSSAPLSGVLILIGFIGMYVAIMIE